MSTSELTAAVGTGTGAAAAGRSARPRPEPTPTSGTSRRRRPGASSRFFASELRLVFRRRRNIALLVVLSFAPILLGIAVRVSAPSNGDGPAFIGDITENGLFLAFTSLVVTLPLFLPLAVSVVSGEAIAGEASTGSLRNLLVVPVGRTRLLAGEVPRRSGRSPWPRRATVFLVGTVVGLLLFPHGPVTLHLRRRRSRPARRSGARCSSPATSPR